MFYIGSLDWLGICEFPQRGMPLPIEVGGGFLVRVRGLLP